MPPKLKEVNYRDGIMSFVIPEHWEISYQDPSGAEFYDPQDDDRTFRLNVLSFEPELPKPLSHARLIVDGAVSKYGGEVSDLGNGYYLTSHNRPFTENGEALVNKSWLLSRMIEPTSLNVAHFTYTYPEALASDSITLADIELLSRSVSEASFFEFPNPQRAGAPSDEGISSRRTQPDTR